MRTPLSRLGVQFVRRTHCSLCGEDGLRQVVRTHDFESIPSFGDFDILVCARCRLGFTEPYPDEASSGKLYDAKTSGDFDVIQDSVIDRIKDRLARRQVAAMIGRAGHPVRTVLDYSTGNARYAAAAKQAFPEARVDAVDYQRTPPPLLIEKPALARYIETADFAASSERYDLIILRHVLEHTHDPVALLRSLGQRLMPQGTLYVEVPNMNSGFGRIMRGYWKGYYVPRHIFHYSRESLAEIASRAGLTAEAGRNDMPQMGNTVAILTGWAKTNLAVQIAGVLLHPFQLLAERMFGSSTCITARCRLAPAASYQ